MNSVPSIDVTTTGSSLMGTLLDRRYRIDSLLARGGMSTVYRGVDTRLDRPVAIKIMDPRYADDRSFAERFEREARSAAKLHHPNVVAVHDQGVDVVDGEQQAFLVMELVEGGTLRDILHEQGALLVPLVFSVAEPVLAALAAAHRAGLIHRDIKPENVLIGRNDNTGTGVAKVGDFGLVRAIASAGTTSSSIILGTVAYLSPEQVTTGAASARGDVYSAGILLFEMLTGELPYVGDTALSVAYRHVNDDVPRPSTRNPDIPAELDDLVFRATRRDPAMRPSDASAFLAELLNVRTKLAIQPSPIPLDATHGTSSVSGGFEPQTVLSDKTISSSSILGNVSFDNDVTVPHLPVVSPPRTPGPSGTRALLRSELPADEPGEKIAHQLDNHPGGKPKAVASSRFSRRTRLAILSAVTVLCVGLVGFGAWWFTSGRYVDIPEVAGLAQPAAEKALREAGFNPRFDNERHNTIAAGLAVRTEPGAGEEAVPGNDITVLLSIGRPVVPDISPGTPLQQAEAVLGEMQLDPRLDPAADKYHSQVPKGTVLSADPKSGTMLNIGSSVLLVLSKGPAPSPVPNVVGKKQAEAFDILKHAGFEPVVAGTEFSKTAPGGGVSRMEPAAGTIDEGTGKQVKIWLSDAIAVPSVIGLPVKEASKALTEAGLRVDIDDKHRPFSFVVAQDPAGGTLVKKNTKIELTVFP